MFDEAWRLFNDSDSWAAVDFVNRHSDPLTVFDTYDRLIDHLYHEAKNVPGMILIGLAAIQYGLARAAAEPDRARSREIKERVKALAYNVAANTWPGWDDPGIEITRTDQVIGLDVARVNLRLAHELQRGDLALARGHWIVGAHLLAARQYNDAKHAFGEAARLALAAGERAESLSAKGFDALTGVLQGEDRAGLDAVKAELAGLADGPFFAGQIDTALKVFSR